MKPIFLILGLVLAAGAGALGGTLVATHCPAKTAEPIQPQAAPLQPAVAITPEVAKRLESLSMEIATLESQIASLRDERSRTPAVVTATPDRAPIQDDSTEVFATVHREAILKVLADERAEQDRKREEERKQREEQQIVARADRVAQKFNLSDAQKHQLTDYYTAERQKFDEMRAQFRGDGVTDGGAETPRDAFREARDWRTNELTRLFGTDLGAQINEFDNDRGRGGVAGGGGSGGVARRQGAGGGGAGRAGQNANGATAPGSPGPAGPRPGGGNE